MGFVSLAETPSQGSSDMTFGFGGQDMVGSTRKRRTRESNDRPGQNTHKEIKGAAVLPMEYRERESIGGKN